MIPMRPAVFLVIFLAISAGGSVFAADTQYERDFKQLTEQHDRELAAAAEPVNRRYQASLEQLLRRATQGNDAGTAEKIREELKPLGGGGTPVAPPSSKLSKRDITKQIVGSWAWSGEDKSVPGVWILIRADGTASLGNKPITWKIGSDGVATLTTAQKATAKITFDSEMKSFSGTGFSGVPITGTKIK